MINTLENDRKEIAALLKLPYEESAPRFEAKIEELLALPYDPGKPEPLDDEFLRILVCLPPLVIHVPAGVGLYVRGDWHRRIINQLQWRRFNRGVPSIEELRSDWQHEPDATRLIVNIWAEFSESIVAGCYSPNAAENCPGMLRDVMRGLEVRHKAEALDNARAREHAAGNGNGVNRDLLAQAQELARKRAVRPKG